MRIIEDDIGTVVQLMRTLNGDAAEDAPYYMFGHVAEVNERIVAMAKSPARYNKRFPLIVLRLPPHLSVMATCCDIALTLPLLRPLKRT